jgi:hypothetical protein
VPPNRRASALQLTQTQWAKWAEQRRVDAAKIEKQYRAEARAVEKMLGEIHCPCDPLIVLRKKGESPDTESPSVTHSMLCTRKET